MNVKIKGKFYITNIYFRKISLGKFLCIDRFPTTDLFNLSILLVFL